MKDDGGRRWLGKGKKLPPATWLYNHPGGWRMLPQKHPSECSWCGKKFTILLKRWHVCEKCDLTGTDK